MHFEESEVIRLLLFLAVLPFLLMNHGKFLHLPARETLFFGFYVAIFGTACTNIEGFWPDTSAWHRVFNVLEHISYALTAFFSMLWCWQVFGGKEAVS